MLPKNVKTFKIMSLIIWYFLKNLYLCKLKLDACQIVFQMIRKC